MAQLDKVQSYLSRDFTSISQDLITFLQVYYPDQYQDFSLPGIAMAQTDLLAYVSDILSYHTDKKFNSVFKDGATDRDSMYRLAKNFNYKVPGYRPALTLVDITIQVPTAGLGPDVTYLPIIMTGMQVKGNGETFETVNDSDFSSDFSEDGVANRKIVPYINSNNQIVSYYITKRELVKAGTTVIYSQEITSAESIQPFYEVQLPETNVLEIVSIIAKPGLNLTTPPLFEEFYDADIRYFEVEELGQDQIFVEDTSIPLDNGIKTGYFMDVPQRFKTDFQSDGSCVITFGGGTIDNDSYASYLSQITIDNNSQIDIKAVLDNTALGSKLPVNSTLYIKYRIGGGSATNVSENILQQVANVVPQIGGADPNINQSVISSINAKNIIPAIGGADLPSIQEISNNISSNYSSQDRCVTLQDYIAKAYQLPGKYGAPFRIYGTTEDNKIKLFIISKAADGTLFTNSTTTIKQNITEYLSYYRCINDYVEINDGKVINIGIDVDIFVDKTFNSNEVKINCINAISDYFNVDNWQMNEHIYISQLTDLVGGLPGVINVINLTVNNITQGVYSTASTDQSTGNSELIPGTTSIRTQMEYINNAIYSTPISIFELKNPQSNIRIRLTN